MAYIINTTPNSRVEGTEENDHILNGTDGYSYTYNNGRGASESRIFAYGGNDIIENEGFSTNVVIFCGTGEDTVYNGVAYGITYGESGNDSIRHNSGYPSTINGGIGDDTIIIDGSGKELIEYALGDGNDFICIWGGIDDPHNGKIQEDINGNKYLEKILLTTGSLEDSLLNGNDVILKIGNDSITLKNAKGTNFTVENSQGKIWKFTADNNWASENHDKGDDTSDDTNNNGDTSDNSDNQQENLNIPSDTMSDNDNPNGGGDTPTNSGDIPSHDDGDDTSKTYKTQQDVIKAFMHSLDEAQIPNEKSVSLALDEAIKIASNGVFKNYEDLITKFVSDCRSHTVNEFMKKYCGIDLSNEDTGAITGWDAGGIVVKTAESIVEESGNLQPYKSSFTLPHKKSGLTLTWNEPDNVTATQKKIVQGLYSWWFKNASDLITESYGITFEKATVNIITLDFNDLQNEDTKEYMQENPDWNPLNSLAYVRAHSSDKDEKNADELTLWINMNYFPKVDLNDCKDGRVFSKNEKGNYVSVSEQGHYLDRYLAHELTHALMRSNINYSGNLPTLVHEGIAELTHGADIRSENINSLLENFRSRTKANVVNSLMNDKEDAYVAGYTLMRYFAKQASNVPEGVHIDSGKNKILLVSNYTGTTFNAEDYFSTIKEIDASRVSQKMTLTGNSAANSLTASKGGSEMVGGLGNDTLHGGNGSDTFVYASGDGDDVFREVASNDKVKITSGTIDSWSINGTDVIFKIGNGSITAKNARGRNITIIDSNGVETTKKYDNETQEDITHKPLEINPVISNTISRISARAAENVVTDIDSLDELITSTKNSILIFTENSGRGIQNADLRSSEYYQVVSLEGGNQNVHFNDETGNVAITGENSSGSKKIIFGDGTNVGIFTGQNANTQVTVGAGDDSIITDNDARVKVDLTDGGATRIIPYSGKVTLNNYDLSTGAAIQTPADDIISAIKDNSIQLRNSQIKFDSATVNVDSPLVNLIAADGSIQKVGFTNGGTLDTKNLRGNFLLKGNYAPNSNRQANLASSISAGDGNDTILAGSRDIVDGGGGKNEIFLTPAMGGAKVALNGGGSNVVHNFHAGFSSDSDALYSTGDLALQLRFDGNNIKASVRSSTQTTLEGVANDADFAEVLMISDEKRSKVAIAKPGGVIKSDADIYLGSNAAVDFSGTKNDLLINLSDRSVFNDADTKQFYGINQVTAGDGLCTVIGNSERNTLTAGNSLTTLTGGAGNDLLIGSSQTTFLFTAGDDHDTISNFNFADDRIEVTEADEVTGAFVNRGDVVLQLNNSDDYLRIEDAAGKNFNINNLVAKVDKNISYDGIANCYVAHGGSSLTVESTVGSAEIWLDNSHGEYFLGNIRTLDASNVTGKTSLVGNDFDNTIRAGHDNSSLWGGSSSSDDLLIGGGGRNTFFYLRGNGSDTIQGTNSGDRVILSDITLEQIVSTNITANSVAINFIDGGSLRIDGTADVTCQLADNSKYTADHAQLAWK